MKVADLLKLGQNALEGSPDAKWDAKELLLSVFHKDRNSLVSILREEVSDEQKEQYIDLLTQRKSGTPLQYILHEAWFMGLPFYVDENVLIPRQDTELLCEEALKIAEKEQFLTALDLCTGSGALAVSLAKYGKLSVSATDISDGALSVAKRNAEQNQTNVTFYQGDFLNPVQGQRFDLIVCNPPYLTKSDMEELQEEVKKEPALALFGGEDGLTFYRRLEREAESFLNDNGVLMMEIGSAQGKAVMRLFSAWNPCLLQDLNGLDRVVIARKPKR